LLRFLFGGLATVAGLVLLFVASFGDPAVVLNRFRGVFAGAPDHAPAVTADHAAGNAPAGRPAEQASTVATPSQTQPVSAPLPQRQADQQPAPSSSPADQTAALRARREALEQQLQRLQAEMAQASQSVSSLHNQADQARHDLDALQQQRAAEAAQMRQLDATREHAAAQAANPPAPEARPGSEQTGSAAPAAAPAQVAQAAEPPAPLPLPPPLPRDPPQQLPAASAASAPAPPEVDARTGVATSARVAASPDRQRPQHVAQTDFGAMQAALDRLRHAPSGAAPQPVLPDSDSPARAEDVPVTRSADAAYGEPRQIVPRARLEMARAALQAGRIDAARQYLEEAQLQLVFRPVTPAAGDAPGASRVAGDVASALSMLGAGNTSGALQYVDRAMAEARPDGYPPPQGYGNRGPYGGAPMADAGR